MQWNLAIVNFQIVKKLSLENEAGVIGTCHITSLMGCAGHHIFPGRVLPDGTQTKHQISFIQSLVYIILSMSYQGVLHTYDTAAKQKVNILRLTFF